MGRMAVTVVVGCVIVAALAGQQAAPAFEVASVKPSQATGETSVIRQRAGGRFLADNVTISVLIQQAYDVFDFQIVSAPGWVDRERFDIQAIAPSLVSEDQDVLLQRLLEERFSLRSHREKREGDIYALVIARADGRLGPNLRPFSGDCNASPPSQSPCRVRNGPTFTDAVGRPFSFLAGQIVGNVQRIVVDKTGLTGVFDFSYKWTNDLPPVGADDGRVSFMTAVEEQLGLKLERTRGLIDPAGDETLVEIDRAGHQQQDRVLPRVQWYQRDHTGDSPARRRSPG